MADGTESEFSKCPDKKSRDLANNEDTVLPQLVLHTSTLQHMKNQNNGAAPDESTHSSQKSHTGSDRTPEKRDLPKPIQSMERSEGDTRNPRIPVLIIGSGLREKVFGDENIFIVKDGQIIIQCDGKEVIHKPFVHYGGGGVNLSVRLARTGHPVLPILSIGNDEIGKGIQAEIVNAWSEANRSVLERFVSSDEFFCKHIMSVEATVFSVHRKRFALVPKLEGLDHFGRYLNERLQRIADMPVSVSTIIIGHVYADALNFPSMVLTRGILDAFWGTAFIYANFGKTQLAAGVNYWEEILRDKVSVIQLSYEEAKYLFDKQKCTLVDIITWLWEKEITGVVTLGVVGSVGVYGHISDHRRIFVGDAYPLPQVQIVDTTGAGDAFAAGMVDVLSGNTDFTQEAFGRALDQGRVWAAYACTTLGSCADSPDRQRLQGFGNRRIPVPPLKDYNSIDNAELLTNLKNMEKEYLK